MFPLNDLIITLFFLGINDQLVATKITYSTCNLQKCIN